MRGGRRLFLFRKDGIPLEPRRLAAYGVSLKRGNFGLDVVRLQLRLDLFPFGYFDDDTAQAVRAFQKAHKLKVDGEVGPKTYAALDLGPVSVATSEPLPSLTFWMNIALTEKDSKIKEDKRPGKHHPRILDYHRSTTLAAKEDEVAWCSSFMNNVMEASGRPGTGGADAGLTWAGGTVVKEPKYGDIVVTKLKKHSPRISGHHVAFYIAHTKTHITILGGNQENMVRESEYRLDRYESIVYIRPKSTGRAFYFKFGNIAGCATAKAYEGWMKIKIFTFGVKREVSMGPGNLSNREPGKSEISRLAITRDMDRSAAALFRAAVTGAAGVDATIASVAADGKLLWEMKLNDTMLSDYRQSAHGDEGPLEALMPSFSRLEVACPD